MDLKKQFLKLVPYKYFKPLRDAVYPEKIDILEERLSSFYTTYHSQIAEPGFNQKTAFKNAEFKVYSKHGGDGILLYIFSKIGVTNRTFVEMGIEDGRECNTSNLAINFGWNGMMIDANAKWVRSARQFLDDNIGKAAKKVQVVESFVTTDNINTTIKDGNISGEIDLLSIDIDGNDFWVWKDIDVVNPRVVVMEYNAAFGDHPVTIAYRPDTHYSDVYEEHPLYFGASLEAMVRLGKEKGYSLVACDVHGHDAYFVRDDCLGDHFVEVSAEEAFYPNPFTLENFGDLDAQYDLVKDLDFETIPVYEKGKHNHKNV